MEEELFNKLTQEEKLNWNVLCLQVENLQLRFLIAQHNQEEFLNQMKAKYEKVTTPTAKAEGFLGKTPETVSPVSKYLWEAGTNTGTLKLVAYSGTSITGTR